MLSLTVQNILNEQIYTILVESSQVVEDLKALIEVESGIPIEQQLLFHNGKPLQYDS